MTAGRSLEAKGVQKVPASPIDWMGRREGHIVEMPYGLRGDPIPVAHTTFDSVHVFQQGDETVRMDRLFRGGDWANAAWHSAYAIGLFGRMMAVTSVFLGAAGSDITAGDSRIDLLLVTSPGGLFRVFGVNDEGIMRGGPGSMSQDHIPASGMLPVGMPQPKLILRQGYPLNNRRFRSSLRLSFDTPIMACGVVLRLRGHGWFTASDLRCGGSLAAHVPLRLANAALVTAVLDGLRG